MNKISNAFMTKGEFNKIDNRHTKVHFATRFGFLRAHHGIRPGQMHMFLGCTGSGKSTVARSVMLDSAVNKKVLIHLSEEHIDDYKYKLNKGERDVKILRNISLVSENQDGTHKESHYEFFKWFFGNIKKAEPDIVFFDNITTSYLWASGKSEEQEKAIMTLCKFIEQSEIPFFVVAHTRKDITNNYTKMIVPEDIRGNARTAMMAPYFYTLQNFRSEFGQNPVIKIDKSRFHDEALYRFFAIHYDHDSGSVTKDKEITFNEMNVLFRDRYKLTEGKGEKK